RESTRETPKTASPLRVPFRLDEGAACGEPLERARAALLARPIGDRIAVAVPRVRVRAATDEHLQPNNTHTLCVRFFFERVGVCVRVCLPPCKLYAPLFPSSRLQSAPSTRTPRTRRPRGGRLWGQRGTEWEEGQCQTERKT